MGVVRGIRKRGVVVWDGEPMARWKIRMVSDGLWRGVFLQNERGKIQSARFVGAKRDYSRDQHGFANLVVHWSVQPGGAGSAAGVASGVVVASGTGLAGRRRLRSPGTDFQRRWTQKYCSGALRIRSSRAVVNR